VGMEGRYLLKLREGLKERVLVREFVGRIHPGTTLHVDGKSWVVVRIYERAQMLPEALAVPAVLGD
jgi:hypothetical protein